ncbi:ABC transporter [Streptomyces spiroverticillatus]|uniref:ABC transporter n=1 Tax=Streptomyces finlayi TaxID=67296 RepID=A0A918WWL9_9ACTN|nr:ABC transporter permease [Streptomyces finlayi]GHA07243.1 ABC transporter [Streptomyces spiroverticillatus]GHC90671.1 ABC transporter [Streptomyces finlayi]
MTPTAVLHSEWIKITSVRSVRGSLLAILLSTVGFTLLAFATMSESDRAGNDLLAGAFTALNFGQLAALAFGATAMSSEYHNGALRLSLIAVPRRGLFYAAKTAVIGALALTIGWVTTFTAFLAGQALRGDQAIGLDHPGAVRACMGAGLYLALMALIATGLTALLRSAVAVLGILIPFTLLASFIFVDVSGVAQFLPDRAGQQLIHQNPTGSLGAWTGLGVTALWAALFLLIGWWSIRRRDA